MAHQLARVPMLPFPDPEYIKYLFSPELDHDCYFIVGNHKLVQPERIGAVKKMLLAHSPVFRAELQDSKLREKGDVPLDDFYPDTFKHLLRYVYGHDNTSTLTFDEADNLLYAAEKYMMDTYKQKLATRLMSLLSVNNICSLLNNPVCFRVLELDAAITRILQYETDKVLASPLFLGLSPEAFVKILEQDAMNVAEIEVWRAAIKWAKEKTGSENGHVLRKQLTEPLKKIRVCTLSTDDFCTEVVTKDILTGNEVKLVCSTYKTKLEQGSLSEVSNEIKARKCIKSSSIFQLAFDKHELKNWQCKTSTLAVSTNKIDVNLLPLEFIRKSASASAELYQCGCTVIIHEIDNNNAFGGSSVIIRYSEEVWYDKPFVVPLVWNGQNVKLLSNKKYTLEVWFTEPHNAYEISGGGDSLSYDNEHLSVTFQYFSHEKYSHVKCLQYQET